MCESIKDFGAFLPLSPAVFNLSLALADGDKHGYGLEVEINAERQVNMGTETLYSWMEHMLKAGLICESDERPAPELDNLQRRYYRLIELGRKVLQSESQRLVNSAVVMQRNKIFKGSGWGIDDPGLISARVFRFSRFKRIFSGINGGFNSPVWKSHSVIYIG